jgi:hypothetical protein
MLRQPSLGPDAHAVADDQHADRQFRIDSGSAHLAVKRPQRSAGIVVTVDAPEQVIGRDMFVEAEIIEQPRRRLLNPHNRRFSCRISRIQRITPPT